MTIGKRFFLALWLKTKSLIVWLISERCRAYPFFSLLILPISLFFKDYLFFIYLVLAPIIASVIKQQEHGIAAIVVPAGKIASTLQPALRIIDLSPSSVAERQNPYLQLLNTSYYWTADSIRADFLPNEAEWLLEHLPVCGGSLPTLPEAKGRTKMYQVALPDNLAAIAITNKQKYFLRDYRCRRLLDLVRNPPQKKTVFCIIIQSDILKNVSAFPLPKS